MLPMSMFYSFMMTDKDGSAHGDCGSLALIETSSRIRKTQDQGTVSSQYEEATIRKTPVHGLGVVQRSKSVSVMVMID